MNWSLNQSSIYRSIGHLSCCNLHCCNPPFDYSVEEFIDNLELPQEKRNKLLRGQEEMKTWHGQKTQPISHAWSSVFGQGNPVSKEYHVILPRKTAKEKRQNRIRRRDLANYTFIELVSIHATPDMAHPNSPEEISSGRVVSALQHCNYPNHTTIPNVHQHPCIRYHLVHSCVPSPFGIGTSKNRMKNVNRDIWKLLLLLLVMAVSSFAYN